MYRYICSFNSDLNYIVILEIVGESQSYCE